MEMRGFTVSRLKRRLLPREDAFRINKKRNILVVTDGITRDLKNGNVLKYKSSFLENVTTLLRYPRPSPAGEAAKAAAHWMAERFFRGNPTNAFECANIEVQRVNRKEGVDAYHDLANKFQQTDYLGNDLAGCVASVAQIGRETISWGYITDCGIAQVAENGDLIARTVSEPPISLEEALKHNEHLHELANQNGGASWTHNKIRGAFREYFRNKPNQKLSYGALTGEGWERVGYYVRTGEWERREGDTVLTYTDGAGDLLFSDDGDLQTKVSDIIRSGEPGRLKQYLKSGVRSEATLAYATDRQ